MEKLSDFKLSFMSNQKRWLDLICWYVHINIFVSNIIARKLWKCTAMQMMYVTEICTLKSNGSELKPWERAAIAVIFMYEFLEMRNKRGQDQE